MRKAKGVQRAPVIDCEVLAKHRDEAIRNSSNHCMIAEAIKEAFPQYAHVSVDLQTVRFSDPEKGVRYIYLTPRICQIALVLFDRGKKNKEFKFRLRGAHIVSMNLSNRQKGKPVRDRVALGRRRIIPNGRSVPDTIGGRPVQRHSLSQRRTFGMRAFTEPDVEELGITNTESSSKVDKS